MSAILNGGRGPRRSDNFAAAMSRSAERRRCPKCARKSALSTVRDETLRLRVTSCRWCDYSRVVEMFQDSKRETPAAKGEVKS